MLSLDGTGTLSVLLNNGSIIFISDTLLSTTSIWAMLGPKVLIMSFQKINLWNSIRVLEYNKCLWYKYKWILYTNSIPMNWFKNSTTKRSLLSVLFIYIVDLFILPKKIKWFFFITDSRNQLLLRGIYV